MNIFASLLAKIGIERKTPANVSGQDGQFRFKVCYHSPYFLLYIKCPEMKHWQIARAVSEVSDPEGMTRPAVRVGDLPIMYFQTASDAVSYAVVQLQMSEAQLETRPGQGFTAPKKEWVSGVKNYEDVPAVVYAKLMPRQPSYPTINGDLELAG